MLEGIGKAKSIEEVTSVEEAEKETSGGMPEEETSEEEESTGDIPGEVAEGGEAKGKSPT